MPACLPSTLAYQCVGLLPGDGLIDTTGVMYSGFAAQRRTPQGLNVGRFRKGGFGVWDSRRVNAGMRPMHCAALVRAMLITTAVQATSSHFAYPAF